MKHLHVGDLIRVLDVLPEAHRGAQVSSLFGYAEPSENRLTPRAQPSDVPTPASVEPVAVTAAEVEAQRADPVVPFVRLERVRWPLPRAPEDRPPLKEDVEPVRGRSMSLPADARPPTAPARWSSAQLAPKIVPLLADTSLTGELDVPRVTERLSCGEALTRWPRRPRRRTVSTLTVVVDDSPRLTPWASDVRQIVSWLRRWVPQGSLSIRRASDGSSDVVPGGRTIIVGDLGAHGSDAERNKWVRYAEQRISQGEGVAVWLLVHAKRIPASVRKQFSLFIADQAVWLDPLASETARDHLLALASLLVQVDADLLRGLRRYLTVPASADTEVLAWESPVFERPRGSFADWKLEGYRTSRDRLVQLIHRDEAYERTFLDILRAIVAFRVSGHHPHVFWSGEEVFRQEVENWFLLADRLPGSTRRRVRSFLRKEQWLSTNAAFWDQLRQNVVLDDVRQTGLAASSVVRWFEDLQLLTPEEGWTEGGRLYSLAVEVQARQTHATTLELFSGRAGLVLQNRHSRAPGSWVAPVMHGGRHLRLVPAAQFAPCRFSPGVALGVRPAWLFRPVWAQRTGRDAVGRWAEVEVDGHSIRLRWIEPGRFLMGSPDNEAGRREQEGPQHEVTLTTGFWMAETPCTQALYEAVTGENPSYYQGGDRPVDNVTWNDACTFLSKLNERIPGLDVSLPTEAQWEYACRAGSTESTYAGSLTLDEDGGEAPELDAIAWYYRNSSDGTKPVAQKAQNAWGLYDTLGNVDEWCSDWFGAYSNEPQQDPTGPGTGAGRVIRGGSWHDFARSLPSGVAATRTSRRLPGPRPGFPFCPRSGSCGSRPGGLNGNSGVSRTKGRAEPERSGPRPPQPRRGRSGRHHEKKHIPDARMGRPSRLRSHGHLRGRGHLA